MKVVKSISLNDQNKEEEEMIRFLKRRSFSKYVKQLIREDLARKKSEASEKPKPEQHKHPQQFSPRPTAGPSPQPQPYKPTGTGAGPQVFRSQGRGRIKGDLR